MDEAQIVGIWRSKLSGVFDKLQEYRSNTRFFFLKLFVFFILINVACYWIALTTTYFDLLKGDSFWYYFKIQFSVGFLGALFDSLSFFITVEIIKRALKSAGTLSFVSHLFIDFIIAIFATAWVLFVFTISGWLVTYIDISSVEQESSPVAIEHKYVDRAGNVKNSTQNVRRSVVERSETYEALIVDALENPLDNLKNIYFGLLMGVSAMIPSLVHIFLSLLSIYLYYFRPKPAS